MGRAIGKAERQASAGGRLGDRGDRRAGIVAHQHEAARQHLFVAIAVEQAGLRLEAAPGVGRGAFECSDQPRLKIAEGFAVALDLGRERAGAQHRQGAAAAFDGERERPHETLRRLVEALYDRLDEAPRVGGKDARQALELGPAGFHLARHRRHHAALEVEHAGGQFGAHRHRHLGSRGGRRRAQVGGVVDQASCRFRGLPRRSRGIWEATAAARTTTSSLKAQRSSKLPPPRATMMTIRAGARASAGGQAG